MIMVINNFKKSSNKFIIFDFLYSKISVFVLINFNFYINIHKIIRFNKLIYNFNLIYYKNKLL